MSTDELRVGQCVRVSWLKRQGVITQLDRHCSAAVVTMFSDASEYRVYLDDLEPVITVGSTHA